MIQGKERMKMEGSQENTKVFILVPPPKLTGSKRFLHVEVIHKLHDLKFLLKVKMRCSA